MWQLREEVLPLPEIKLQSLSHPPVILLMVIPAHICRTVIKNVTGSWFI
jgi:hypothetical protein